jgi:peptidoglycan/LPS O-acetylase OafA/YrhL
MPVFGVSNLGLYSVLILSVIIATPVSWLSYKFLELPYFKRTNHFTPLVVERARA